MLGGAQTWLNNSAGLLTVSGKIANGGNLLTTAGSGTDKISGVLSGAGGLTVSGGSVSLTAAATYSGSTSVTSGTLNLGVANAFGSSPGINIGPGATLLTGVSNATGVSAAGPIVVSGQFIKGAAAGLQESLFRPVILSGGTMSTADPGVSGDATTVYNGSTYYYAFSTGNATNSYVISTSANSGTSVIGIPAGNSLALRNAAGGAGAVQADQPFFTSGAGSTLDVVATLVDWNSASTIGDGINISGSGTVVFSPPAGHPNVYGRNTDIISGTLQVGNTGAIPSGSIGEPYASNVEARRQRYSRRNPRPRRLQYFCQRPARQQYGRLQQPRDSAYQLGYGHPDGPDPQRADHLFRHPGQWRRRPGVGGQRNQLVDPGGFQFL